MMAVLMLTYYVGLLLLVAACSLVLSVLQISVTIPRHQTLIWLFYHKTHTATLCSSTICITDVRDHKTTRPLAIFRLGSRREGTLLVEDEGTLCSKKPLRSPHLLCRCGCSSHRCICCWHSGLWGQVTINLSSRFLTRRLEGRHCCSCSRWRSTGQKSCSFMKLLRQWKQYVWPQGVSMGLSSGCRQMWHTSSSSTSSWYSYRWFSGPSCCWPHSLQTRAHDRPAVLLLLLGALVSVAAMV